MADRLEQRLESLDRIIDRMQAAAVRPSVSPHIPYEKSDLLEDLATLVAIRLALECLRRP